MGYIGAVQARYDVLPTAQPDHVELDPVRAAPATEQSRHRVSDPQSGATAQPVTGPLR